MSWVLVALAGAAGAVSRAVVDHLVRARLAGPMPLGTVVVNVTGGLLAGLVAGAVVTGWIGPQAQLVVAGGYLGAYTTFSTAMVETVGLAERHGPLVAGVEVVGHSLAALVAAGAGWALAVGLLGA